MGRCFESGILMATSGEFIHDCDEESIDSDCEYFSYTTCRTTKVAPFPFLFKLPTQPTPTCLGLKGFVYFYQNMMYLTLLLELIAIYCNYLVTCVISYSPLACCAKLMPCWPLGTLAGPLGLGWPLGPPSSTLFICKHLCNLVTKQSKPVWLSSITYILGSQLTSPYNLVRLLLEVPLLIWMENLWASITMIQK